MEFGSGPDGNLIADKQRASRNQTLTCTQDEIVSLSNRLLRIKNRTELSAITNEVINGDFFEVCKNLPREFVDLLILDPPYNLTKNYNGNIFNKKNSESYSGWFRGVLNSVSPILKKDATIYVCADWATSVLIAPVLGEYFNIHNRITWEREKGRGAKRNWKNNAEDIWFCTMSENFYFDVDAVKMKRKVLAPYKTNGKPKDWKQEDDGNFRITYPSNIWTDISVPFWSMPENTDHPTQKPEKLIAKLILASCPKDGFVFDPFLGSGTSSVVAEKLGRLHAGIELDETYSCWARKRIDLANKVDNSIQGYTNRVFWERNSLSQQTKKKQIKENEQGLLIK